MKHSIYFFILLLSFVLFSCAKKSFTFPDGAVLERNAVAIVVVLDDNDVLANENSLIITEVDSDIQLIEKSPKRETFVVKPGKTTFRAFYKVYRTNRRTELRNGRIVNIREWKTFKFKEKSLTIELHQGNTYYLKGSTTQKLLYHMKWKHDPYSWRFRFWQTPN